MPFTALVSDSTAGLPNEFVERHGVRVVPLYVNMDGETYRDGVDISAEQFYERLPHCSTIPTTSQPSAGDFASVYRDLVEQGVTGIISIHISSGISGTVSSAQLAAADIDGIPIEIVDTRCTSAVQVFAVEAGAWALEAGAPFDEALASIQQVIEQCRIVFSVDTLEYLYKNGRIGGAAALMGSLLQFKPLLYFRDGQIDALERVRTSRRSLARMVELMVQWLGDEEPMRAMVVDAGCKDRAKALLELLHQHMNVSDVQSGSLTPVLGCHVGNGTLALCCCPAAAFPVRAE